MDDIEFMSFISNIRKGIVNQDSEFLDKVNQRYVGPNPYAAATQSHSNAIWLANTNAEVKEMNLQQLHNLKSQGKTAITT